MADARDPRTGEGGSTERVLVVALTYRRPDDLAELLPLLLDQVDAVDAEARILVVDNDPEASARAHVTGVPLADPRRPVDYLHAPTPGIAAARNAALRAGDGFELLVFIDDDERPVGAWLPELIALWRAHRPAAVVGPVVSEFATPPDPWIIAGRFFDRRRLATGTPVDLAATNNLLLDLGQVRALGLSFDERFGLSGGSDTLFTRQLHARGGVMLWCDEAVVVDKVPTQRLTRDWVVRRAYRAGNTWMRTSLELSTPGPDRLRVRLSLAGRGLGRVIAGAGRAIVGLLIRSMGQRARGVRTIARGAGLLSGAFGSVYHEYSRPVTHQEGVSTPA